MARITITEAAKRGFSSRPTLYRAIKDGRLTAHQDGDKKALDLTDLVKVFGEPGPKPKPAAKLDEAVQLIRLEVDRARLAEEVERPAPRRGGARWCASRGARLGYSRPHGPPAPRSGGAFFWGVVPRPT